MRKLGLVVFVLSAGLVFSGCFLMRTLTWSDDSVKAGKKTTAKITVSGDSSSTPRAFGRGSGDPQYPFFFILSFDDGGKVLSGVFDKKSVFKGPVKLRGNPELGDKAGDECLDALAFRNPAGRGPSDFGFKTLTTKKPFKAKSPRKFMDARFRVKVSKESRLAGYMIFMGTWIDDGDGVPEDPDSTDDAYICQPPYITALKVKGAQGT